MGTSGVVVFVIVAVIAGVLAIANRRRAALNAGWAAVGHLAATSLYFGLGRILMLFD